MKVNLVHWFYRFLGITNNHIRIDIEFAHKFYSNERTLVDGDMPNEYGKEEKILKPSLYYFKILFILFFPW